MGDHATVVDDSPPSTPKPETQPGFSAVSAPDLTMDAIATHALSSAVIPFLDRPAEIRNAIYEILFQRDEPVVLVVKPDTTMDTKLMRRAIPNRELLYTCKQVFQESSSTIYASNTWLVTFGYTILSYECTLLDKVGEWLACIGTKRDLLRRIEIDITTDALVTHHSAHSGSLDIVALTEHAIPLQRQQSPKLSVQFIPPRVQPALDVSCQRNPIFDYISINQALNSLTSAIPWDLQVYLRSRRSLSSVCIVSDWDGNQIELQLRTRAGLEEEEMPRVVYEVCEDHNLRRVPDLKRPVDLHQVLELCTVRSKIFDMVTHFEGTITYDLNRHTTSHALPGAFHVDRRVRDAAISSFYSNNFAIKLTDPDKNDGDFHQLDDFLRLYRSVAGEWFFAFEEARLLIEINKGEEELHDVRFKAIEFAEATHDMGHATEVCVQLVGSNLSSGKHVLKKPLEYMRNQLLQFFSQLMNTYPDRHFLPRRTIWMDHQGCMIEAHFLQDGRQIVVRNHMMEEPSREKVIEYVRQLDETLAKLSYDYDDWTTLFGCAVEHAQMYREWDNEPEM